MRSTRSNHYTSRPFKAEDIDKLDPEAMLKFYQDRFANAADFTFFFVGAFKVDEVAPLLSKYLGSLAVEGHAGLEVWRAASAVPE